MNQEQRLNWNIPAVVLKRPLSMAVAVAGCLIILVSLYLRFGGLMLLPQLDNMDAFTPVMISILILRGVYALRKDTDLQAVSIALIVALSFIFVYEAIYKISFYPPYNPMPPAELREFLIQVGTALTVVAGFAFGKLHYSRWSRIFTVAFILLYGFWILIGFPQVNTSANALWTFIPVHLSWNMIYLLNRSTKVLVFFTYLFFYSGNKPAEKASLKNAMQP